MPLVTGDDGRARCAWGAGDAGYRAYHDTEWGRPVTDERGLYEKLSLECLQSGLSWALILRKRDGIRDAFAHFDPDAVARFGTRELERLLADSRVIRNRRKLEMRADVALPDLVWSFRRSADAKALATELKRRGFAFVGPTTIYSTMQAVGLVNDHEPGCWVRAEVAAEQRDVQDFSGRRS
jgi:DNA-3-methyladenine glycosylase I